MSSFQDNILLHSLQTPVILSNLVMVRQGLIAWYIEILHIRWPMKQLFYNTESLVAKKNALYQNINIEILAQ